MAHIQLKNLINLKNLQTTDMAPFFNIGSFGSSSSTSASGLELHLYIFTMLSNSANTVICVAISIVPCKFSSAAMKTICHRDASGRLCYLKIHIITKIKTGANWYTIWSTVFVWSGILYKHKTWYKAMLTQEKNIQT